jgi:uncharacterized protein YbjT (DUF2867 family)
MQTTLAFAAQVAADGRFYAPLAEAKTSMIDARDVAAVAARALTEEGHEGKVHELTGAEAISHREIAEKLSGVLGRPVEHVEVSFEDARGGMLDMGMPEWLADALGAIRSPAGGLHRRGDEYGGGNHRARATGYEEFARDYKEAFSEGPAGS